MEAGTSFGRWYSPGEAPLPQDDACAEMYRAASRVLGAAGYEHYEVRRTEEGMVYWCQRTWEQTNRRHART